MRKYYTCAITWVKPFFVIRIFLHEWRKLFLYDVIKEEVVGSRVHFHFRVQQSSSKANLPLPPPTFPNGMDKTH